MAANELIPTYGGGVIGFWWSVLGICACAAGGVVAYWWTGQGEVIDAGGTTVLVSERTGSGMEALIGGRIEEVGGCLGVEDTVVIWPHGTEVVDEDPLTIAIPDVGRFAEGDEIALGGGGVHAPQEDKVSDGLEVAGVDVLATCGQTNPVALTHNGG